MLKPGGHFLTLEPSNLYPLSWITRPLKRIVGNITDQVEDEGPFLPLRLSRAMARCGLEEVNVTGASFSHNRLPVGLAKLNNAVTRPLLTMPVVKCLAWLCVFYGRKPADKLPVAVSDREAA